MISWLIDTILKHCVKDYEDITSQKVRSRYGILSSIMGISCNIFLFVAKGLVGLLTNSVSILSDAFNNLSDAASSIISFVGVKMAEKPADKEHPFGHGRMEYIVALIVAFLVLQVGFTFLKTSVAKILHPEDITFHAVSFYVLVFSVIIKLWIGVFNRRLGAKINSTVMKATALDSFGDAVATTATIVSLLCYQYLSWNIDGYVGLIVSIMVLLAGINIIKETITPLIGESIDTKVYDEISSFVEGYDGIIGTHDLIVHNYGPSKRMASIHAEVPSDVDIETSHEIIDCIERDAMKQLGIFLVIHMDPVAIHDERVTYFKQLVVNIIKDLDKNISIHDFRFVYGIDNIRLVFDMVVPHEYSEKQIERIKQQINKKVQEKDVRCQCVIDVDRSFIQQNIGES